MKYLKLFENKYTSWDDVIRYIKLTLVPDEEEYNNIFLDWSEYIQGKYMSVGNLSMPKFVFCKQDHLILAKRHSQDVFNGGLNQKGRVDNSVEYGLASMLNKYIFWKRRNLYKIY